MKHALLLLLLLLAATMRAQDIQIEWGEDLKLVGEVAPHTDNSQSLVYGEVVLSHNAPASTYFQLYHEQKFWRAPVFVHAELRTFHTATFTTPIIYLAGGAYGVYGGAAGYCTIEALYRHDGGSNWQATVSGAYTYKRLSYEGYADVYGLRCPNLYSENRFTVRLLPRLHAGLNVELTAGQGFIHCRPFGLLKFCL